MITLVETALHYAHAFGWAVHPVDIKKQPTTKHGRNDATREDLAIRSLFRNGAQIGVATGSESNLFVLDVDLDEKRGINGYETLEYLEAIHGALPPTPHQRTGRGGTQYFFNYVDGLKNSTSKIGAGIDTRGRGGYVVVAPSRNTNGPYQWIVSPEDTPLADVPAWLITLLKEADAAQTTTATPTGNERTYCLKMLGQAVARVATANDGQKHETLLKMATWMGGFVPTIAETEIEAALFAAIELRAEDHAGARKTIQDGIAYGKSRPLSVPPLQERVDTTTGEIADPSTAIIAGEVIAHAPVTTTQPTSRFRLYNLNGMRNLPPVTWLIEGEVPAGLTTLICGASEAGKSFLAIDYALRTARANPDRAVVYIAPEGGSGYHQRVDAWLAYHGGPEPTNIFFILQSVTILNPQTLHELIATIRSFNPVMLVIDTLARTLVGGDENSAKDVGMFFYHTDIIREQTHAAILVVHHTGKTGQYRGSSSLIGSVDSWIDFSNDDGLITVACGKAKDWERFPPRYLRMVKVGDSVVLVPSDQVDQRGEGLSEGKRKILETLALDIFRESGARRSEIVSASGINELTIYKVLSRMKRDRLITQSKKGDPYFISDEGMDAIKSFHRDLRLKREANELAKQEPRPNAQLANSQRTSNELSTSFPNQLATSNNLPSIREGKFATSSGASSDSSGWSETDLFPEDDTPSETEPITDMIARIKKRDPNV